MIYTYQNAANQSQRVNSNNTTLLGINLEDDKPRTISNSKVDERYPTHTRSRSQTYPARTKPTSSFSPERRKPRGYDAYIPPRRKLHSDDNIGDSTIELIKVTSNREPSLQSKATPLILSKPMNYVQITNRSTAQSSNSPSPDRVYTYNTYPRKSSSIIVDDNKTKITSFTKTLTNLIDTGKKLQQSAYSSNIPDLRTSTIVQDDVKKQPVRGPSPSTIISNHSMAMNKKVVHFLHFDSA